MKRVIMTIASVVIVAVIMLPVFQFYVNADSAPARIINLVFDDSGSMIIDDDNNKVDSWCQAKYALEVFAGMLGENDTLNVYMMSDYMSGTSAPPKLILQGKNGMSSNINEVHKMLTKASGTPFETVKKAYSDLTKANASEKWLVILTDGQFEDVSDIDSFFANKESNINLMFLSMGKNSSSIKADASKNIYCEKADNSKEILGKITDICTRIFNSDKLNVNVSTKSFSFDVPMSELTVFAQGANVSINGLTTTSGKHFKNSSNPVTVKYSNKAATNYNDVLVDKNLLGSIVTFKDDFEPGDYMIDVSGAETIEIYYKPNVSIAAYLKDGEGNEVTNIENLETGEYTIEFGFVKAGTNQPVPPSKLLGTVQYAATVTNAGVKHDKVYASGDKIQIQEGDLAINVKGSYLDYHTVATDLNYSIYKNKGVTFEELNDITFNVLSDGIDSKEKIKLKALIDGNEFTKEQWDAFQVPTISFPSPNNATPENMLIEKSDEIGILLVLPSFNEKPRGCQYTDCTYKIESQQKEGLETWSGSNEFTVKLRDSRSWLEQNKELIIKLIILAIILVIIIGYLPFVKHYLPKRIKKKPTIRRAAATYGVNPGRLKYNGRFEKNLLSTLIPYVPQTGTIKITAPGTAGVPVLKVKAVKGNQMIVQNINGFVGKDVSFNGTKIKKDDVEKGKFKIGSSMTITVFHDGLKDTCTLNQ